MFFQALFDRLLGRKPAADGNYAAPAIPNPQPRAAAKDATVMEAAGQMLDPNSPLFDNLDKNFKKRGRLFHDGPGYTLIQDEPPKEI